MDIELSPTLLAYINELVEMQGFGATREIVIGRFVWKEVNRLIEAGRLKQLMKPLHSGNNKCQYPGCDLPALVPHHLHSSGLSLREPKHE